MDSSKKINFGQFDLKLTKDQDKVAPGLGHGGLRPMPS
jgi:hypothetical protein